MIGNGFDNVNKGFSEIRYQIFNDFKTGDDNGQGRLGLG